MKKMILLCGVFSFALMLFTFQAQSQTTTCCKKTVTCKNQDSNNGVVKTCPKTGATCSGTKTCNTSSKCNVSSCAKTQSSAGNSNQSICCQKKVSGCCKMKSTSCDTTKKNSAVDATKEKANTITPVN